MLSVGSTVILMDTTDPAAPVRLTSITQPSRFPSLGYHSAEWADGGADPYLVLGTEIAPSGATNTAGSDCEGESSVIETWDASKVVEGLALYRAGASAEDAFTGRGFSKLDAFDAGGRGVFLQGMAPAHVLYCAHWMEQHPDFAAGGLVAVSYYDRGTRFIRVADGGEMTELGWIVPADGYSGSVQWASDDIAYIMDYRRGMEVVRFTDTPATSVVGAAPDRIAPGSQHRGGSPVHVEDLGVPAIAMLGVLMAATQLRRRRSAAVASA